jgi:hypothetical protein
LKPTTASAKFPGIFNAFCDVCGVLERLQLVKKWRKKFQKLDQNFLHLRIILVYIANNSYLDDAGHRGDTGILNKH